MYRNALLVAAVLLLSYPSTAMGQQPQFKLPFHADSAFSHLCTQGNNDTPSHDEDFTRFDLDFDTPNDANQGDDPEDVLAASAGTAYAFGGCDVGDVSCNFGFGNHVKVDHGDGLYSIYAHLDSIVISDGQSVLQGDVLGKEGATGAAFNTATGTRADHIHFGVHQGEANILELGQSVLIESLELIDQTADSGVISISGAEVICGIPGIDPTDGHVYESTNRTLIGPTDPQSLSGRSFAVFENPKPTTAVVDGVGTNFFSWGDPTGFDTGPSTLEFNGAIIKTEFGNSFALGILTFFNGHVSGGVASSVNLEGTIVITIPRVTTHDLIVPLTIISTQNSGTDPIEDADAIYLPPTDPSLLFSDGEKIYYLKITGFRFLSGDGIASRNYLTVFEEKSASVELMAVIGELKSNSAMPWLMLLLD